MSKCTTFTDIVDVETFADEVTRIEDLSDRVRLAGYGLAAPLVTAREGQMRREVARVARRKGADHPEVPLRQSNLERAEARFALFSEELDRTRISRPEVDLEEGASIWGRVVDDGVPQAGLTVSAFADGVRLDFSCTDDLGGFVLELPADTELILSVHDKDGAELFRDRKGGALATGQLLYREIDLTRGAEKPCPTPGPDMPPDESFPMIDLVGRTEAAARSLLANQGLKVGQRSEKLVTGKAGLIISHAPEAGTLVKQGDSVDILVGAAAQVQVPDLIGLTLPQADELLKKLGLKRGQLTEVPVENERAGLIVDQVPAPGGLVDPGAPIDISISVAENQEPQLVAVPDVTGFSADEAAAALKESGLTVGDVSEVPVPEEKVGLVVGQSPGPGAMVEPNSAVALVVGKPRQEDTNEVTVPNLRGMPIDDAIAILEQANLAVGDIIDEPTTDDAVGRVLAQEPKAGSVVDPGSTVNVVVGTSRTDVPPRDRIPAVIGQPLKEAERILVETGFQVKRKNRQVRSTAQDGIVLAQTPKAETVASRGATVTLTVGTIARDDITTGVALDAKTARIAEIAEAQLSESGGLPEGDRAGSVARRLQEAGVRTMTDVDKLLRLDRRELREALGLRTLAQTDRFIGALKRARRQVGG